MSASAAAALATFSILYRIDFVGTDNVTFWFTDPVSFQYPLSDRLRWNYLARFDRDRHAPFSILYRIDFVGTYSRDWARISIALSVSSIGSTSLEPQYTHDLAGGITAFSILYRIDFVGTRGTFLIHAIAINFQYPLSDRLRWNMIT